MTTPRLHELIGLNMLPVMVPETAIAAYFLTLTEGAELMLRGCGLGCIPPLWFATWHPLEKRALAEAADRIHTERALIVGVSSQGPVGVARVASRFDGGRAIVRAALERVLKGEPHERLAG